jgi:hypothetical protein
MYIFSNNVEHLTDTRLNVGNDDARMEKHPQIIGHRTSKNG